MAAAAGSGESRAANAVEQSTLSNSTAVRTTALHLEWTVDFEAKALRGVATHTMRALAPTDVVVFDTNHLIIDSVTVGGALTLLVGCLAGWVNE